MIDGTCVQECTLLLDGHFTRPCVGGVKVKGGVSAMEPDPQRRHRNITSLAQVHWTLVYNRSGT